MLKHGILGLLNYGSMSGYEIMEAFRDSLSYFWTANTSQIYRELQTLENKGFVFCEKVVQSGRPDKKIYSTTEAGKAELKKWLGEFSYGNENSGLLMKVFFSGELPAEKNIERFRDMKRAAECNIERFKLIDGLTAQYKTKIADPNKSMYWDMTVDFGLRYAKMLADWCDACAVRLMEE